MNKSKTRNQILVEAFTLLNMAQVMALATGNLVFVNRYDALIREIFG